MHILDSLGLDGYHIFYDGALVFNCKENINVYSQFLPPDVVRKICEFALYDNLPLDLFSANRYFAIEESWRTAVRREYFKISPVITDFTTLWQKEEIIKGSIVTGNPDEEYQARKFASRFEKFLNCVWTVTPAYPSYFFINVNNKSVSKGRALEALVNHLDLDMRHVAAIGDGANDISLLSASGLAIAMKNSPDALKNVADYITDDVEHHGVANAIRQYIL